MTDTTDIRRVAPAQLAGARAVAHKAVQHLTRAARANLPAAPDDSHSNLSWLQAQRAFISQPMDSERGPLCVGLSIADLDLFLLRDNQIDSLGGLDGLSEAEVAERLDARLADAELASSAPVELPYELPADVGAISGYSIAPLEESLSGLAAWYGLAAEALTDVAGRHQNITPGPSPVRCWPHHFDIATYLSLEEGDFETARGIGIGLSPGDESYGEPYLYVNPWPHLDAETLPPAPAPGHWHTDGFVGAIATATEILTLTDIPGGLSAFIGDAVETGRRVLGG